jgi:hypothetical protein
LNINYKKKEAFRIDIENQKMIERITNAGPSIPLKQMEEAFERHL